MTAPQPLHQAAEQDQPRAADRVLALRKPGGALHILELGQYGWSSPCGWVSTDSPTPVADDASAPLCGRCVQLTAQPDPLEPCPGCTSPLCHDCNRPTESRMFDWLRRYYMRMGGGNGQRFAFARHVRSRAGFDARTADAVAMDLWTSKGLELHGIEIKISRSDWQNELRQPDKWRAVGQYMDRWWLAVPDLEIVRGGELPEQWGLLIVGPTVVHVARRAPKLQPLPVDRSFLAALFRAATKSAAGA